MDQVVKERDFHYTELQKLRVLQQETEREFNEVSSNYDKDKALWDNKVRFLEQQKE